jgi:hypothetical protein
MHAYSKLPREFELAIYDYMHLGPSSGRNGPDQELQLTRFQVSLPNLDQIDGIAQVAGERR